MGYLFLLFAKLAGAAKMAAMKFAGREATGTFNSIRINLIRSFICMTMSIALFAFDRAATGAYLSIALVSGVANAINMCTWILCAARASLCVVEIFMMFATVVIPLLLSPFLYVGETVTVLQWLGVVLILAAVILFAVPEKVKTDGKKAAIDATSVILIVVCMLSSTFVTVTQKLYVTRAGKEYTAFFNALTFILVFVCFVLAYIVTVAIRKRKSAQSGEDSRNSGLSKAAYGWIAVAAAGMVVYQFTNTLASAYLPSAILYPLAYGSGFLLTAAMDTFLFREKVTLRRVLGTLSAILGSVMTVL